MSDKLLKKFFKTTSLGAIDLETIYATKGQVRMLWKSGDISEKKYKKYDNFLTKLGDEKLDLNEDVKKKLQMNKEKALARNAKEESKVKKQLLNIDVSQQFKPGHTYLVSYACRVKFPSGSLSAVYVSQSVKARDRDTKYDMISYAFEEWIKNHYTADSPPEMVWSSVRNKKIIENGVGSPLQSVGMASILMLYKSFEGLPEEFKSEKQMCVIDYLMYESAKSGRKKWFKEKLQKNLGTRPSTETILNFIKAEGDISMYALDMFGNVFLKHVPVKSHLQLFFMVNSGHLYPILNDTHRQKIRTTDRIHLADMTLSYKDFDEIEPVTLLDAQYHCDLYQLDSVLDNNANHIVVTDMSDLTRLAGYIMKETKTCIEHWKFSDKMLVGFQHPSKKQVFSCGKDYADRELVCEREYAKKNNADFKWMNQGWGMIGRSIFENEFGDVPSSQYSPDLMMVLKKFPVGPYRMCIDKTLKGVASVDITKCYSSILLNNTYDYPLHGSFDCAVPIKLFDADSIVPGQYYTNKSFSFCQGMMKNPEGWHQYEKVLYAVQQGYLKLENIKYVIPARRVLKATTFKTFVKQMYADYPQEAKKIVNCFVGCLGSLYHRKESAGVSSEWETAEATINDYEKKGKKMMLNEVDDLFIVRMLEETMKTYGDMPIYRSIIGQAHIALDKMTKALVIPGKTKIVGFSTDSIKLKGKFNTSKLSDDIGGYRLEETKELSGYTMAELSLVEKHKYEYKPQEVKEVLVDTPITEASEIRIGAGGCGKSWLLGQTYVKGDVVLALTNACCETLKKYGVDAQTFDSFVRTDKKTQKSSIKIFEGAKRVWLDEYKTLPPSSMDLLLRAKAEYKFQLICLGDPRQTHAPTEDWVEYHTNRRFLDALDGRVVHMSYNSKTGRYDEKLYKVLEEFVLTGVMKLKSRNLIQSDYNVCKTNLKRHEINKARLDAWCKKNKEAVLVDLEGHKGLKKVVMRVAIGLEMMVYDDSDLEKELYKTHRYTIVGFSKKEMIKGTETVIIPTIKLKGLDREVEIEQSKFVAIFDYSFAYTMYKIQSITIDKPFNIHEAGRMSHNELYTAVSRGKRCEDVHIDDLLSIRYVADDAYQCRHTIKKAEEKRGRIYLIRFNNESAYVGFTEQNIYIRFHGHFMKPVNADMADAMENCEPKVELLEEFVYHQDKTWREIERNWIDRFKDVYKLLNRQHNAVSPDIVVKMRSVRPKKDKLNICEETGKSRFLISVSAKGVRKKYYESYGPKSKRSKEEALLEAQKVRDRLLKELLDGSEGTPQAVQEGEAVSESDCEGTG